MNIYDFTVRNNKGDEISLAQYQGKTLLIVNTATKCGLTPQYEALEALYLKYKNEGLEILDFPCNQFLEQAPGSDEEIQSFCSLTYHTTFPRFSKIEVNGENAHPLYVWLRAQIQADEGDETTILFEKKIENLKPAAKTGDIKWNFGKFLINKKGEVVGRYSPALAPDQLEAAIKNCMKQGNN